MVSPSKKFKIHLTGELEIKSKAAKKDQRSHYADKHLFLIKHSHCYCYQTVHPQLHFLKGDIEKNKNNKTMNKIQTFTTPVFDISSAFDGLT